jgi:hypothetical protein
MGYSMGDGRTRSRSREGRQKRENRVVAIYDYPLSQGALNTKTLTGATLPKRLTGVATSGYHHER